MARPKRKSPPTEEQSSAKRKAEYEPILDNNGDHVLIHPNPNRTWNGVACASDNFAYQLCKDGGAYLRTGQYCTPTFFQTIKSFQQSGGDPMDTPGVDKHYNADTIDVDDDEDDEESIQIQLAMEKSQEEEAAQKVKSRNVNPVIPKPKQPVASQQMVRFDQANASHADAHNNGQRSGHKKQSVDLAVAIVGIFQV
ncbi:hypothetical protein LY76DRAFT_589628 [Colletotrichum caudatum]|nr:hypothetical protein LY76DRAFT_589628 [Colletotrichum caudatum]